MSQQYQRFKHNFFREHPPQQSYHPQRPQTNYELNNNFQPTSNDKDRMMRNQSDDNLRIEQQSHYPFQEIQHPTFNQLTDDPFLAYHQNDLGRQQNFSLSHTKNNTSLGLNSQDFDFNDNFSSKYQVSNQFPQRQKVNRQFPQQKRIGFKGEEGYDNYSKNIRYQLQQGSYQKERYVKKQQQQIQKINQQLQKLRVYSRSEEQKYANRPAQNITTIHPQPEQAPKHYVIESRSNLTTHDMPVSPQKQLPVIFSRSQVSTNNSISKINSPPPISPNNSRIIIQHSPPVQGRPPTLMSMGSVVQSPDVFLSRQVPNSQVHYVQNPVVNSTNSNSRMLIQSQTLNKNLPLPINNYQVLPPHNNQVIHLPAHQGPPAIKFSDSQPNQFTQPMIPLKQYQRLRNQCVMWQQKYYQTSEHLIKFQSQSNNQFNHVNQQEVILLQQQNNRLKEKIHKLENNDKLSHDKIKQAYQELISKYEDSLTKQCELLVDRFRLEMKHNSRG